MSGLKTSSNNSDAALIATEHAKQNMSVPAVTVLNMRGQPLMPTTPRKAKNLLIKQVRKFNRKLFKGDRSHIKNTALRIIHGFQRFDKVLWNNMECFVFGRRERGYFNLQKLDGTKIHTDANVKGITLLERSNTFLVEPMRQGTLLSVLKNGVPATPAPQGGV